MKKKQKKGDKTMKMCGFASCEELTITENAWSIKQKEEFKKEQNNAHVEKIMNILKFKLKNS